MNHSNHVSVSPKTREVHFTGSVFYNYVICPRKAWLMQYQINPEQEHVLLDWGRLVTDEHYQRGAKEWELPGIKIDRIRREDGELVVGEVKKSSKGLEAGVLQLGYYLYRLEQEGIQAKGELLIPHERKCVPVALDEALRAKLAQTAEAIEKLLLEPHPPKAQWLNYCPNCAYAEFCWSGRESEEAQNG